MPRQRLRLPFGNGIDRATGPVAVQPGAWSDLRNVEVREGRVRVRDGLQQVAAVVMSTSGDAATHIVFIGALRASSRGIVVGFQQGGGADNLEVFVTASTGLSPTGLTPVWATLASDVRPPRVLGCESYRAYFLAHDEPDLTRRVPTVYVDDTLTVQPLALDLGGGVQPLKFRGVERYLNYVVGWGYGNATDPDRPDLVRVSIAGDPTNYDPQHYFLAGQRSEPVLRCLAMQRSIFVFKESETYEIRGTDRATFGIQLVDPLYGVAASRLAVQVAGTCYFWSLEGPRVIEPGQPSQDIAVPLDLTAPEPADLAAAGELGYGWAEYIPESRTVDFAFPDEAANKTRVYSLSLRDPQRLRWSYKEYQRALYCTGRLYAGQAVAPPVGYPAINIELGATSASVTVNWGNTNPIGDEVVEVWLKAGGGAWTRVRQVLVASTYGQFVVLTAADGVLPGTLHTVALRYRRGGFFTAGYDDPVIAGWSPLAVAQSVNSVTTEAAVAPPIGFRVSACLPTTVGGAEARAFELTAQAGAASPNNRVRLMVTSSPTAPAPTDGAEFVADYTVGGVGVDTVIDTLTYAASSGDKYFWLYELGVDGGFSSVLALDTNPLRGNACPMGTELLTPTRFEPTGSTARCGSALICPDTDPNQVTWTLEWDNAVAAPTFSVEVLESDTPVLADAVAVFTALATPTTQATTRTFDILTGRKYYWVRHFVTASGVRGMALPLSGGSVRY